MPEVTTTTTICIAMATVVVLAFLWFAVIGLCG